jgi:hypothetical protein
MKAGSLPAGRRRPSGRLRRAMACGWAAWPATAGSTPPHHLAGRRLIPCDRRVFTRPRPSAVIRGHTGIPFTHAAGAAGCQPGRSRGWCRPLPTAVATKHWPWGGRWSLCRVGWSVALASDYTDRHRKQVMPRARRQMALTAELVARAARVVEDLGPSPGAVYMTDEDYDLAIQRILADRRQAMSGCSAAGRCCGSRPARSPKAGGGRSEVGTRILHPVGPVPRYT